MLHGHSEPPDGLAMKSESRAVGTIAAEHAVLWKAGYLSVTYAIASASWSPQRRAGRPDWLGLQVSCGLVSLSQLHPGLPGLLGLRYDDDIDVLAIATSSILRSSPSARTGSHAKIEDWSTLVFR
jgi:hypothetical protein